MKTVGLITEYNPFHNGHAYHIEKAKELTGADRCIVVMSGNFVQRGEPAILDKYPRAKMALLCGADLVLELPVFYAAASAEYFARGAVSLLDHLGVVDQLCFGSECGDIDKLSEIARILSDEPDDYRWRLKGYLSKGMGFPAARQKALVAFLSKDHADLLSSPNNILGIEYLKALYQLKSSIIPVTISRVGAGYHQALPDASFSSATSLRMVLRQRNMNAGQQDFLRSQIPSGAFDVLNQALVKTGPVTLDDFSGLMHYRLLQIPDAQSLTAYLDISSDLADRIYRMIPQFTNCRDFIQMLKTKHYTDGRIQRSLLHILLDIRTDDLDDLASAGYHHYLRVLGFKKESSGLLSSIKEHSHLPLITKLADAKVILPVQELAILKKEILISHIYQSIITQKYTNLPYSEYKKQLIII